MSYSERPEVKTEAERFTFLEMREMQLRLMQLKLARMTILIARLSSVYLPRYVGYDAFGDNR